MIDCGDPEFLFSPGQIPRLSSKMPLFLHHSYSRVKFAFLVAPSEAHFPATHSSLVSSVRFLSPTVAPPSPYVSFAHLPMVSTTGDDVVNVL